LSVGFDTESGCLTAVDNVSITVGAGEVLCLVGESGCGKSVTALSVTRLLRTPPARYLGGRILLDDRNVLEMSQAELQQIRGKRVGYVFQDPMASLNPVFRVGSQIREVLRLHRRDHATDDEIVRLLQLVGLPSPKVRMRDYPHQLSGGMRQRVMIAMALASNPALLVADEPTTALDVTIQAQVLDLFREINQRLNMAILLITHNLGIIQRVAHRVAVMYAGQVVETGSASDVLLHPMHPYTRALLNSSPRLGSNLERLPSIPGRVPPLHDLPKGCRFHPRCAQARPTCATALPELIAPQADRQVRCPWWNESATPPTTLEKT
jgi:oligopeptide/dipeptide ABC transporter ATP-binding protein